MKTLKIRFVKRNNSYTVQQKTWFGWKDLRYVIDMGYGSVSYPYGGETKELALEEVLERKFKVDRRFVEIIEYPTIKIY
jgi:hypothetical protein